MPTAPAMQRAQRLLLQVPGGPTSSHRRAAAGLRRRGSSASQSRDGGLGYSPVKRQWHRPERDQHRYLKAPKKVSVIGAPLTLGQPFDGVDEGPQRVRGAGLLDMLRSLDYRIEECGDLSFPEPRPGDPTTGNARNCFAVGSASKVIADQVEAKQRSGSLSLVIGGDHSIACGTLAGVLRARPDAGVLWVDAHADVNTPSTSASGNIHGMPVGMMLEGLVDHASVAGFEWMAEGPALLPGRIAYVGLRDLDAQEVDTLRRRDICAFSMTHIDRYGIGKVMEMALEHLGERPLMVSYDIDAVDPNVAPSTGTSVRGGLTYREAHYVCEAVAETGRLVHLDMVEVNPALGESDGDVVDTTEVAVQLCASALGDSIL